MEWVAKATPRPIYPKETNPVPIEQEDGGPSRPIWTGTGNLAPDGAQTPDRPARSDPTTQS